MRARLVVLMAWVLASWLVLPAAANGGEATQTVAGGGVTAKVTFTNPKGAEELRFTVALDTHSVNLDAFDLRASSTLHDDKGNRWAPSAVEKKGSGHHQTLTLIFPKPTGEAKKVELIIKELAGIKERKFRWDMK